MIFYNASIDDDNEEIYEKLKDLDKDHERYIQEQYDKGTIPKYENGNGKSKNHNNSVVKLIPEKEIEKNRILNEITRLRRENPNLTFEQWTNTLIEKRHILDSKINESFPEISLELDFILSIKTILNIEDITLPFMGIVFAVPSSMKTQVIEILRKWIYSYFTDKFTAKSFVSHSATVAKDKLKEVDMLPRIKDKILLTPELSPLFTGKDEDIKEQFGIITRLLDGNGLETESGVHGQRGYYGKYMFTWIGAAVDIPHSVYKFLSTIGFKIYFLRLPRTEISEDDLVEQTTTEKPFNEKMREIEKLLLDYLNWFEICPISIGIQKIVKIEWDKSQDDKNAIRIIARLAILLARLRGNIYVYKSSDRDDLLIPIDKTNTNNTAINYSEGFIHSIPIIENPSRANQQLYNLARGHALSNGRNYITEDDISLVIKVVLSTGSIERVLILDLLIANKGTLTTSQITTAMSISNNTAKRTMTEFKGLELVTMERTDPNKSNSEYKITLNPKFEWFLTDEFKKLGEGFKPIDNKDQLKTSTKTEREEKCYDEKSPCVPAEENQLQQQQDKSSSESESNNNKNNIKNDDIDTHRGEIRHSIKGEDTKEKKDFMSVNHLAKVAKTEEEDNQIVSSQQTNSQRKREI
jgi:hypothetical protein